MEWGDTVATIKKVARKSRDGRARHAWRVRYVDPDGRERAKDFPRRDDAKRFANKVEADKDRGEYLDPKLGRVTVAQWFEDWFATTKHLKPKTREGYESLYRCHVKPRIGTKSLASVRAIDVRRVVSELTDQGLSRSRVRQVHHLLGMIFGAAVENGSLGRSPVGKVKLLADARREKEPLTVDEAHVVADNVPDRDRALIYLFTYGGLRWGEAAALRRGRVNVLGRKVLVREAVSEAGDGLHYGLPKTHQVRDVTIPRWLADMLAAHLADYVDNDPDALVFTGPKGGALRYNNFVRDVWLKATRAANRPGVGIHHLRHTCASLLYAHGAQPIEVAKHLGHSSTKVTEHIYLHLYPEAQERVADTLDRIYKSANGG
jgi:integrase